MRTTAIQRNDNIILDEAHHIRSTSYSAPATSIRYQPSPSNCSPSLHESTPLDDRSTNTSLHGQSSDEPSIEEVDRLLMEAAELAKRKRPCQESTLGMKSKSLPISTSQFHVGPSQVRVSEPQDPSIEEIDRLLMDAEEMAKKKRLSSQSLPTQYPQKSNGNLSQGNVSHYGQKKPQNGISINHQIRSRTPLQNSSNVLNLPTSQTSSSSAQFPLYSSKENDIPIPSYSGTPSTKTESHIGISYDTISLEDFAALEEMEQFALSQRNTEVNQSESDFNYTPILPRQSILPHPSLSYSSLDMDHTLDNVYICRRFVALEIEDTYGSYGPSKRILCAPTSDVFGDDLYSILLCDDW